MAEMAGSFKVMINSSFCKKIRQWIFVPLICWFNRGLLTLLVILAIPILILLIEPFFHGGWTIELSSKAVQSMVDYWDNYAALLTLFGASLTLYIASIQLKKHLDVQAINALSDLRTKLNTDNKKVIHNYLLPFDDKSVILAKIDKKPEDDKIEFSNLELFDYLGTIELGAIMLKRKVITIEEFYNQFGYRVENLVSNADVLKHLYDNREYYTAFMDIVEEVIAYNKNRNRAR